MTKSWRQMTEEEKDERRKIRKMFGNPSNWGGKRQGAGRPRSATSKREWVIKIKLNPIQVLSLKEIGNGYLERGVEKIINEKV